MTLKIFAQTLKQLRKANHLSQQQVSDIVGIQRSAYAYYEIAKSMPKWDTLIKIASMYHLTVDELMSVEQNKDKTLSVNVPPAIYDADNNIDKRFTELNDNEKSLVMKYRIIEDEDKEKLFEFINLMDSEK